jgi:hypothetical protein
MTAKIKDHPSDVVLLESLDVNLVQLAKEDDEDEDKKPCFKMLAYTGAEVSFYGERAVFNTTGMEIASQKSPIFRQHDPDRIAGFSEKIEKTAEGSLQIEGRLCPSTEAGREVAALAADGFPWQASVGLSDVRWTFIAEGDSVAVNGKKLDGPIYVADRSVLRESSFVPLGADGATKGVVLSAATIQGRQLPQEEDAMDKTEAAASEAKLEAEKKAAREDAVKEERVRIAQLRKEFSAFPDFVVEQIEKGNDLKSAKAEFADLMRKKNEELSAENARLVAESKKQPIVGAQPVKLADGENNAQLEARSFIEMARELKAKTGKPLHVCMSEVSIRNPAAYAAQDANLQAKKEQVAKVAASRGRQTVN